MNGKEILIHEPTSPVATCWTPQEEEAISHIMQATGLDRLPATRLMRRYRGDVDRAIRVVRKIGGSDA